MKNNLIRVLMLSPWYPHKYDSMPGLFVQRHAQAISSQCDVCVLYIHADENLNSKKIILEKDIDGSLAEYRIYYKKTTITTPIISFFLKFFWYYKAYRFGLKKILEEKKEFDIIHVNILTRTALVAYIIGKKLKIPYVITEHWSRYLPIRNEYHGVFRKMITRFVVSKAKAILPVTENLKNAMLAHKLNNINYQVIPNVVDTELFCRKEKYANSKKQIVHVSCFEDKPKNISGILRTAKNLFEKRKDFEIHLVGDGLDLQALKKLADELGIINKVVFFEGLKENEDLVKCIASADFMLLFSNYENMPVVINESLACGIPVLSSRVGGIPEIIIDENGILVNPNDEQDLFEKMDKMLNNYNLYNPQRLRDYALANFSKEAVATKIVTIYKQIIERK